ncbi:MAG: permease, partial [Roseibium sp.]|uniref:permease n=1 Tax=Roseibium sp. TaxID=1936156 RepID=UPI00260F541A
MTDHTGADTGTSRTPLIAVSAGLILTALTWIWPDHVFKALSFAVWGLVEVSPLVIPGIFLAAWIVASGADTRIARIFERRTFRALLAASAIGAITPVCGVTVLPLMAGLLAAGVPLAPIMAFWLSSPITDPAMLATTAATLGYSFAFGKTIAAFGLGVFGGVTTALFSGRPWAADALRDNRLVGGLTGKKCCGSDTFRADIWNDLDRMRQFRRQFLATSRLILICLFPAFTAEYVLNAALTPGSLTGYVGENSWWAIPAAVFVGAPAYIDGYAALPLTRGLIDHGMSKGAAMAFLVSGGVVSIWG